MVIALFDLTHLLLKKVKKIHIPLLTVLTKGSHSHDQLELNQHVTTCSQ